MTLRLGYWISRIFRSRAGGKCRVSEHPPRLFTEKPAPRSVRGGFTLLELIVVLTILAAMTAAVMPVYQSTFRSTKTEDAIQDFYATLQYAESISISEAAEYRVYLNTEENAYWVAKFVGRDEEGPMYELVDDAYRQLTYLPAGLSFKKPKAAEDEKLDETYYISFHPSGACDYATVYIEKEGMRFRHYEIQTRGRAGRMVIEMP